MQEKSTLQKKRLEFQPRLPNCLKDLHHLEITAGKKTSTKEDEEQLKEVFEKTYGSPILEVLSGSKKIDARPLQVGVVFSGGQAPGGHNVIAALFDALMSLSKNSRLLGFLGGPQGIIESQTLEITEELLTEYRNQGGFDLIGSGRDKIETKEQLEKTANTVKELNLDGLVIIGGDDSNTNAAVLAEYFAKKNISTRVVGVPKTIDGDLRNEWIEMSFGFDTACKTYAELIGNICKDSLSAKKYYHFIRLMGRSASHIALECALKTQPNYTIIAEEVSRHKKTLKQIAEEIGDLIVKRAKLSKKYGVILIPEGLIEFIPEVNVLIQELNAFLANDQAVNTIEDPEKKIEYVQKNLTEPSKECLNSFPKTIQKQLLLDRDPHGNVQVSKIETEKLILEVVQADLRQRKDKIKLNGFTHFFGYEGRSALPSNFDAQYCYALGRLSAFLIHANVSGYMCCISNLKTSVEKWRAKAIPITMLMNLETRHGRKKPVIKKYLVDLEGKAFQKFSDKRSSWELEDRYLSSGPIQFYGDSAISESIPSILD